MVQTLSPGSWRSLMKTIFPFTLPFVCGVVEDFCGVELAELGLIASTFRVVIVVTTATTKQINKRKQAALVRIELKRISNIKYFLSGVPHPHFTSRLAKTAAVFGGRNERLDHFCLLKITVELVQLS